MVVALLVEVGREQIAGPELHQTIPHHPEDIVEDRLAGILLAGGGLRAATGIRFPLGHLLTMETERVRWRMCWVEWLGWKKRRKIKCVHKTNAATLDNYDAIAKAFLPS